MRNALHPITRRQALLRAGAVAALAPNAWAQSSYPNRPIRFIVPFPAGSGADVACRNLTQDLAGVLGQPIVVDNRGGAAGSIGSVEIAKAAPDGYTIGYGNVGTLAINRSLFPSLPYNPDGFTPIATMGRVQNVLVVRNESPFKNVQQLIDFARKNPGKLNMASGGNGTTGHLGGELFKALAGVFMVHVPYRGAGPAITDLMGGGVDLMFDNIASSIPHIRSGRLRALGVSGAQRSPVMPDVPTIQEAGLKNYDTTAWGGVGRPGRHGSGCCAAPEPRHQPRPDPAQRQATLRRDGLGNHYHGARRTDGPGTRRGASMGRSGAALGGQSRIGHLAGPRAIGLRAPAARAVAESAGRYWGTAPRTS